MIWDLLMLQAMNGLVWGLIIALIALGLSIIFGLLDIVNVAHGELFMLGAVLGWTSITVFGWVYGIFWFSLLIVPFILFVFGMGIERWVLRKIENNASLSIVATFGLSLIFQEAVRATFGAAPKRVLPPIETTVRVFGFDYSTYRFVAAAIAAVAIAGLFLYLHKTQFGTWMRAVRQDREMATAMGIPTDKIFMVTFGLGAGLAALGGVAATPITTVEFTIGTQMLPTTFIAVIIGGLGNLLGTVAAAILVSEMVGIASVFMTPTAATVLSLVFMAVVLQVRPEGLFTRRRR